MSHTAFPDADTGVPDTDVVGDVVADFAAAAREWPHRPAIVHNGAAITYRDLAERVRLTALRYRASGFAADGPSGLIGALVSHTPAVVEHLLGILQARAPPTARSTPLFRSPARRRSPRYSAWIVCLQSLGTRTNHRTRGSTRSTRPQ